MKKLLLLVLILNRCFSSEAQIMFQHLYKQPDSGSVLQTFDAKQTNDGGYVLTGLASQGSTNIAHPFIMKTDCKGNVVWEKYFGVTQTIANTNARVIITQSNDLVMINNLGGYQNYIGLAVRLTMQGSILWQKEFDLSSSSDALNDVKETSDQHLIFTGSNQTTSDVSLIKTDAQGNLIWHKSFGNNGQYDDGYALTTTQDGGYLVTGRYISMGTFNALLLKTDSSGTLQWLRCYGDTNQHMHGYDVKELANGEILMVGSTTLLKPSYQSYADNFIMKLNAQGDTLWTKIFYGTPDQFENISSIIVDAQGNYLLGMSTASYPTVGFVPNKNGLVQFDSNGNLMFAKLYNNGSSHYTRISGCSDGTVLLSSFGNKYGGPIGFQTLLVKTDTNYLSGCFDQDVTSSTTVTSKAFKVTQPTPSLQVGATLSANGSSFNLFIVDSVLCETHPVLHANFTYADTCISDSVFFQSTSVGASNYSWHFGDGSSATSNMVKHQYAQPGTYVVTLFTDNGCFQDSISQTIHIQEKPSSLFLGNDTIICSSSAVYLNANSNYPILWNTGDTSHTIIVSTAGIYTAEINSGACGFFSDSIEIQTEICSDTTKGCEVFIANAFSPNGDQVNDDIGIRTNNLAIELDYMEIRNRWGNLCFSSSDISLRWDGKINGREAASDTYYYFIRLKCKGEIRYQKGDLLLVR